MRKTLFALTCLVLPAVAVSGCSSSKSDTGRRLPQGKIELLRDRWGVPHIFAETDAGAMYGLGYAAAEDRAFQMCYNLRIIQGRLAELIGDVKVGVTRRHPCETRRCFTNSISSAGPSMPAASVLQAALSSSSALPTRSPGV